MQGGDTFLDDDMPCRDFAQRVVEDAAKGRIQLIHGDILNPMYNDATHLYAASTTWPDFLLDSVGEIAATKVARVKTFSTLRPLPSETLEKQPRIYLWKTVDLAVSWQDTAPIHIYRFRKSGAPIRRAAKPPIGKRTKAE